MSHIVRIDSKNTKGWQVRLSGHSKLFSDSKYGGKERTKVVAQTYMLDNSSDETGERPPFLTGEVLPKNNKSGVKGVYRTHEFTRGRVKRKRDYWAAFYTIDRYGNTQVRRCEKFHVDTYGETGAKEQAIAFRKAWEKAAAKSVEQVTRFFATWRG